MTRLEVAEGLLETLCEGLEADNVDMPPELFAWWVDFQERRKKKQQRIQLLN